MKSIILAGGPDIRREEIHDVAVGIAPILTTYGNFGSWNCTTRTTCKCGLGPATRMGSAC